jgi:hypothetical protein
MVYMRIFLSHVLPKENILKFKQSQAGNNFAYNLIEGGCFDLVYSILPSNIYGDFDTMVDDKVNFVFSKRLRRNKIFTVLAVIIENVKLLFKIKSNSDVWFYNITFLNFFSFIIEKFIRRRNRAFIIVLDFTPAKKSWSLQRFYLWLMNRADGMICLSDSETFKCKNKIVLPGVVPSNKENIPEITSITSNFLLSGVISERISMASTILEVFSLLPECNLYITGHVEDLALIKSYSQRFSNIHFLGTLSYDKYLDLLHNITFGLSARNIDYEENRNNFPSKIIEQLFHNRIIISTMEYSQISELKYFKIPHRAEEMRKAIKDIISLEKQEILTYANQSKKVYSLFNTNMWKEALQNIELNRTI